MTWEEEEADDDDEGQSKSLGNLVLRNDKCELLAQIIWFYPEGPFYAYAMNGKRTDEFRRIGPCDKLEGAKEACDSMMSVRP